MGGEPAQRNSGGRRLGAGRLPSRHRPSPVLSIAFGLALVFPSLTLTACGLESLVYYSPPGFALGGGNIITLTHNSANVDSFLGYDIYYRAYSNLSDATNARTTIENASNLTTATPDGVLSQLTGTQGFKKVFLASNSSVPPTPLFSGATTYTIQLIRTSSTADWYYTTDLSATPIELVRGTGSGESFNSSYLAGTSSDYTATDFISKIPGSSQSVFIVAFAVAYGYDFTKLQSIYSLPASLYQVLWDASTGYPLP
jgi:hypothetical protein